MKGSTRLQDFGASRRADWPASIPHSSRTRLRDFRCLVGLSYLVLGVGDLAAILVSIGAGTLTIPVAAWLSRRTFGPGAGAAAAGLPRFRAL